MRFIFFLHGSSAYPIPSNRDKKCRTAKSNDFRHPQRNRRCCYNFFNMVYSNCSETLRAPIYRVYNCFRECTGDSFGSRFCSAWRIYLEPFDDGYPSRIIKPLHDCDFLLCCAPFEMTNLVLLALNYSNCQD